MTKKMKDADVKKTKHLGMKRPQKGRDLSRRKTKKKGW